MQIYAAFGILILLGIAAFAIRKSGVNAAQLKQAKDNEQANARITEAVEKSPNTHDAVVKHLRDGGKL